MATKKKEHGTFKKIERGIRCYESEEAVGGKKRIKRTYYIYGKHNNEAWHEKVGPSLEQARKARRQKLIELEGRERFPEQYDNEVEDIRLEDFALLYRDKYLKVKAVKSWSSIMKRVNRIRDLLGKDTIVSDISKKDVRWFLDTIAVDADKRGYGQHPMSRNATWNRFRGRLMNMMAFAVDEHYARFNPVEGIDKLTERKFKKNFLSSSELNKLIEKADPRLQPMIIVTANTALRQSEAINLRWQDVSLDSTPPTLTVRAVTSKTDKSREVPLNTPAIEALSGLQHEGERVFGFECFPSKLWNKAREDAGLYKRTDMDRLEGFNWHSLRHHAASWMAMAGNDIYKVKDILGHASVRTTERYAHQETEALVSTVHAIDDLSEVENRLKNGNGSKADSS